MIDARGAAALALALGLCGCTSISADQTVPAFASATSAANASFLTARAAEADAMSQEALGMALSSGTVRSQHCVVVQEAKECSIALTVSGQRVDTGLRGPVLAKDMAALADYADRMKDLAAAADIASRRTALQGLTKSVGAIFTAAGMPEVGPVLTLAGDVENRVELSRRRRELVAVAEKVDPAVQKLAGILQRETGLLQQNVVLYRSQAVAGLEAQFGALRPDDPSRTAVATQLIAAAGSERSAALLTYDFSALGKAHADMIESLKHAKPEKIFDAITDMQAVLNDANAVRTAFSSGSSS